MENLKSIESADFQKGFLIDLECCMCRHEETVASTTTRGLQELLDHKGWKWMDSDKYKIIGYYCGCDYRENDRH